MAEGKLPVASPSPTIPAPECAEREGGGYGFGVTLEVSDVGDSRNSRGALRQDYVPSDFSRLGGGRSVEFPLVEGQ